jgi:hypothetical protein
MKEEKGKLSLTITRMESISNANAILEKMVQYHPLAAKKA